MEGPPRLTRRGEVQTTNGRDCLGIAKIWKDIGITVGSSYHNNTSWVLQSTNKTIDYNCFSKL
jgi:hypothetical protein